MHKFVFETVEKITGVDVKNERRARGALVMFVNSKGVGDLIVDHTDIKLLIEIAAIYSDLEDSEILVPELYTALSGTQGAYVRKKQLLDKNKSHEVREVERVCSTIQDLFPHVEWNISDKTKRLIVNFQSGITGNSLISLIDWAPLEAVPNEFSVMVRFSVNCLPKEESEMNKMVPEKYRDSRFNWSFKGRRENYWYCKYLSIAQLMDLLLMNEEILKPDELH